MRNPELSTGATVAFTESAIKNAIEDAFVYLGFSETKPEIPRSEAEIEAFAKELYGEGAENLNSSKPEDAEYVKRVYKENGKDAFVAYAFTYSQYGDPEFEFVVHVDAVGNVKGIKKILWKVSDPAPDWGYNPPSETEVDALFASFVGKNVHNINSVEIETGATNTAGRVRDAVLEAIKLAKPKIPREISEIEALAKELYANPSANLEMTQLEGYEYTALLFKESNSSAYVAYAFAYSQYGTPEFEFLIHVDSVGSIKAVKKILWKVSDPAPNWGYNPPSEAEVDAFFASFVGKNANTVTSVDVSTGATNTASKVRDAALETLNATVSEEDDGFKYTARAVGIAAFAIGAIATAAAIVINKKRRAVK